MSERVHDRPGLSTAAPSPVPAPQAAVLVRPDELGLAACLVGLVGLLAVGPLRSAGVVLAAVALVVGVRSAARGHGSPTGHTWPGLIASALGLLTLALALTR